MIPLPIFAAKLTADPAIGEVIQFVFGGLLVVVVALTTLALSCTLAGWILRQLQPQPVSENTPAPATDSLDDEIVAVLAAAVAATIDKPHRIVHVRGLTAEDAAWAREGRVQHHSSHTFPHRDSR